MQFAYIVSYFLRLLLGFDVFSTISYANKFKKNKTWEFSCLTKGTSESSQTWLRLGGFTCLHPRLRSHWVLALQIWPCSWLKTKKFLLRKESRSGASAAHARDYNPLSNPLPPTVRCWDHERRRREERMLHQPSSLYEHLSLLPWGRS